MIWLGVAKIFYPFSLKTLVLGGILTEHGGKDRDFPREDVSRRGVFRVIRGIGQNESGVPAFFVSCHGIRYVRLFAFRAGDAADHY